jgi:phosphoglycerol transferase MdoB-like AlkP superfamily enzyme
MAKHIFYLLKVYFFWVAVFFINRLVFILYFIKGFKPAGTKNTLLSFVYGLRLDFSAAAYLFIIPFLVFLIQMFLRKDFYSAFLKTYTYILVAFICLISAGDLGVYQSWGTRLNMRALSMLAYPTEAFLSMASSPIVVLCMIMIAEFFACYFLFKKLIPKFSHWRISAQLKPVFAFVISVFAFAFFTGTVMRGGFQQIPINESSAYFCAVPIADQAAINIPWYITHSFLSKHFTTAKNDYISMPQQLAEQKVAEQYTGFKDSSITQILTVDKPNIVFIQLESFTADVVNELGGDKNVTPNLSHLIKNGILFSNIYASGTRTDQGIAALLCGFPAQPLSSIIYQSDKLEHLPFLSIELHKAGYNTSFYYGGDLGFGNFNAVAHFGQFEKITGLKNFSEAHLFNKWGADDETMLTRQRTEMQTAQQPFFSYIITLSSHEPFTVPMQTVFKGDDLPDKFKNACYFTDKALGEYFDAIKNTNWYKNTLFVLVADHGHQLPKNRLFDEPAKYHIPLIFFGDVIKPQYRGTVLNTVGSQTDIAATLLHQLNLSAEKFKWSNDLLQRNRKQFAFYTFDNGFGWITDTDAMAYDARAKQIIYDAKKPLKDADVASLQNGKAYLQCMIGAYLKY